MRSREQITDHPAAISAGPRFPSIGVNCTNIPKFWCFQPLRQAKRCIPKASRAKTQQNLHEPERVSFSLSGLSPGAVGGRAFGGLFTTARFEKCESSSAGSFRIARGQ